MNAPADHHPQFGGKTFDDWWASQVPDRAPEGPRHARRGHARPGWLRSLLNKADWYWQAQRSLKARLHARNQATIAWLAELRDERTTAERISEMPSPWPAAPASPLLGAPLLLAPLPEVMHGAGPATPVGASAPSSNAEAVSVGTDPIDVLTPEEEADEWVGDLGPAELAEPEPQKLRDRAENAPLVTSLPAAESSALTPEPAPKKDTAYPDWPTGQFAIADAEIGADAQ